MFKEKAGPVKLTWGAGLVLFLTFLVSLFVFQPDVSIAQVPTCYGGAVSNVDGQTVPEGKVRIYLEGYSFGDSPYTEDSLKDGIYRVCLDEGDTSNPIPNKPVVFKVLVGDQEYAAVSTPAEIVFHEGDFNDQVNLTIDIPTAEIPAGGTTSGGGSSTGGGTSSGGGSSSGGGAVAPVSPAAGPAPGSYTGGISVTLTCATPGAKIYYTTDGSDPKTGAGRKEYTAPLAIAATTTVKAVASKNNLTSAVSTFGYAIVSSAQPGGGAASGGAPPAPDTVLSDLRGHWAADTVKRMVYQGVIKGYEDNTFRPENEISRLEAAAILVRALKLTGGEEAGLDAFSDAADVPEWGRQSLATAVKEGLIKGYPLEGGKTALNPDSRISRAETAVLLSRMLVKKPGTGQASGVDFSDRDQIPAWAEEGISVAVAGEIVKGYPDNTFAPDRKVTRAECAVMAERLLKALEK